MGGNFALDEEGAKSGIEAGGEKVQGYFADVLGEHAGVGVVGRQGVVVGDEEIALVLVLELDPVVEGAHVVAEVEATGGAHAGEDTGTRGDGGLVRHSVYQEMIREMAVDCGFGWDLLERKEQRIEGVLQGREEDTEDEASAQQHNDEHPEHADAVVHLQDVVGEEVAQNAAAVERRDRDEVEDEEHQIDEDDVVEEEGDGKELRQVLGGDAGVVGGEGHGGDDGDLAVGDGVLEDEQQDQGDGGRDQVAGRAGEGDEDVVAAVVLEVTGRDGSGFGPAEEHSAVDEADEREEHGAKGVEVLERIEGDSAEHLGGRVAKTPGGPCVGALMHAEGQDEDNDLKQNEDDTLTHIC